MWQLLGRPATFTVAEPGAGNGLLCRDILAAADGLPDSFVRSLRYVCLDLRGIPGYERGLTGVSRLACAELPLRGMTGCVLSNELLDAFPVHQVTVEQGRLREVYAALEGDGIATQTGEPSTPLLARKLARLGIELAEGQTAEVNLALEGWVEAAAQSLERGFVLTIDYGRPAKELYSATERFRGTLTTYRNHLQTDRPLERIGQQDMSAQMDFTSLAEAGANAGLELLGYDSQRAFLNNLGLSLLEQRRPAVHPRQAQSGLAGMRELAKPGGTGRLQGHGAGKGRRGARTVGLPPVEASGRSDGATGSSVADPGTSGLAGRPLPIGGRGSSSWPGIPFGPVIHPHPNPLPQGRGDLRPTEGESAMRMARPARCARKPASCFPPRMRCARLSPRPARRRL